MPAYRHKRMSNIAALMQTASISDIVETRCLIQSNTVAITSMDCMHYSVAEIVG